MTALNSYDRIPAAPRLRIAHARLPQVIDYAERALVVAAFLVYVNANYDPRHMLNFVIALADVITVYFILFRRPANSVSPFPLDWVLALGGTLMGMLARPGGEPIVPPQLAFGLALQGLLITFAAKFSLNRSFGIAPANRGVQMRGAYVFIRHPMYVGYALAHTGYLLVNPTLFNAAVLAATCACQVGRVLREENWLMQDRAYRRYARVVRYRMIPGLF